MNDRPDSDTPNLPESDPGDLAEPTEREMAGYDPHDTDPHDETTNSDYVESPETEVDGHVPPDAPDTDEGPRRGCVTPILLLALLVLLAFLSRGQWAPAAKDLADDYAPFLSGPLADLSAPAEEVVALDRRLQALENLSETTQAQGDSIATLESERTALREQLGQSLDKIEELERTLAGMRGMVGAITAPDGELSATRQALNQLASRVGALESGDFEGMASRQDLDDLKRELAGLMSPDAAEQARATAERLGAVNAELRTQIAALSGRLDTLAAEASMPEDSDATLSLVLALNDLRDAARGSEPFADHLARARDLAADAPNLAAPLDALQAVAAKGVPSVDRLHDRFAQLAEGADLGDEGQTETLFGLKEGGWVDQTLARLLSVITVRRADAPAAPSEVNADALRAAGVALAADDLVGAATELRDLEGEAAERFAGWLADANRRVAVDTASRTLQDHAVALLKQTYRE